MWLYLFIFLASFQRYGSYKFLCSTIYHFFSLINCSFGVVFKELPNSMSQIFLFMLSSRGFVRLGFLVRYIIHLSYIFMICEVWVKVSFLYKRLIVSTSFVVQFTNITSAAQNNFVFNTSIEFLFSPIIFFISKMLICLILNSTRSFWYALFLAYF